MPTRRLPAAPGYGPRLARTRSTNDLQIVDALLLLRPVIYKVNEVYTGVSKVCGVNNVFKVMVGTHL